MRTKLTATVLLAIGILFSASQVRKQEEREPVLPEPADFASAEAYAYEVASRLTGLPREEVEKRMREKVRLDPKGSGIGLPSPDLPRDGLKKLKETQAVLERLAAELPPPPPAR